VTDCEFYFLLGCKNYSKWLFAGWHFVSSSVASSLFI